jgi:hypothetical protein
MQFAEEQLTRLVLVKVELGGVILRRRNGCSSMEMSEINGKTPLW